MDEDTHLLPLRRLEGWILRWRRAPRKTNGNRRDDYVGKTNAQGARKRYVHPDLGGRAKQLTIDFQDTRMAGGVSTSLVLDEPAVTGTCVSLVHRTLPRRLHLAFHCSTQVFAMFPEKMKAVGAGIPMLATRWTLGTYSIGPCAPIGALQRRN